MAETPIFGGLVQSCTCARRIEPNPASPDALQMQTTDCFRNTFIATVIKIIAYERNRVFRLGSILTIFGYLLMFVGSISLIGVFFYGVYAIFAESLMFGLSMIGASVVGGFILRLVSGALMLMGAAALEKSSH